MNTFSNFSSLNGWALPGSGTWVEQDNPAEDFYVDDNGDLWVPCLCGEEEGEAEGRVAGPPLARNAASGGEGKACVIEYKPDRSGSFVLVNYPRDILYYPLRALPSGRPMGMLADADKGSRWFYKGAHSGKLRLHIAQRNATDRMAVRDVPAAAPGLTQEPIFRGVPLRYAIILENYEPATAAVTIQKQGACIGRQSNAAQAAYFRSRAGEPVEIPPMSRVWLYLGASAFLRDEGEQERIAPGDWIEAQVDLEISGRVTLICCAYTDKGLLGAPHGCFEQTFWPLPEGLPDAATGVGGIRQLDGSFSWAIDDATWGAPASLDACPAYDEGKPYRGWVTNLSHAAERAHPGSIDRGDCFAVRGDIVPLRVPVAPPADPADLERALFGPPPGPVATEARDTENCPALANRGVVYHQIFTVENRGRRERHVQYYVTGADGPDRRACVRHAGGDRIIHYCSSRSHPVPEALVANVLVPAGEKRTIETYFISDGALGHRLTVN